MLNVPLLLVMMANVLNLGHSYVTVLPLLLLLLLAIVLILNLESKKA